MNPAPSRDNPAGAAYLDLRKLASETNRPTDELLQLYALEGFLGRLAHSPHSQSFILKGGVLLAAFEVRRPTRDIDFAAINLDGDMETLRTICMAIASFQLDDGLEFDTASITAEAIRDDQIYPGIRVNISGKLATARIRFHVDVNLGDPIWPEPLSIEVPRLLGGDPVVVAGYPIELVLAEKIVTAIQRGTANTRWRDFVDIANLADSEFDAAVLTESIQRVALHREAPIRQLVDVLDGYSEIAQSRWAAWRRKQQLHATPESFAELLATVIQFADPHLTAGESQR